MKLDELMEARADRIDGSPITLGQVKSRARTIKRRRTAGAAAAGVAVVALVAPIAVLAGGLGDDGAPQPARDPLSTVAPQDPLDMQITAAAPDGADPANAWIEGTTLHRLDGSRVEVRETYQELYVVGGDVYLGVRRDSDVTGGLTLDEIGGDGDVVSSRPVTQTDAVVQSADKTVAAYTTTDGDVRLWDRRGETTLANTGDGDQTGNAVAVTGSGTCEADCAVIVNPSDPEAGEPVVYSVQDPAGEPLGTGFLFLLAVSADGDLQAGTRTAGVPGGTSCSDTWDVSDAAVLHSCESSPASFSPDGRHTAESAPYRDGEAAWIEIHDARTGALVVKITGVGDSDTSQIEPVVWEDDTHYLVNALSDGRWRLLRGDLDGRLQVVAGPVDLPDPDQPYVSPYAVAP